MGNVEVQEYSTWILAQQNKSKRIFDVVEGRVEIHKNERLVQTDKSKFESKSWKRIASHPSQLNQVNIESQLSRSQLEQFKILPEENNEQIPTRIGQ
jgi:hypothetical protein